MPCWTSPWPVAAALDSHLLAAGLERCQDPLEALSADALIVYSPPDVLLAEGMESSPDPPLARRWSTTYRQLQSHYGRHRLIAAWRLQAMAPEAIRGWLEDASPLHATRTFPEPEPLSALVARALLDSQPDLLEAYLDLELVAELAGGEPDTAYLQRLSTAVADSGMLLESCWRPHQRERALLRDKADHLAREDALAIESQQAREAETRLRDQLARAREEWERLSRAQRVRDARLRQLEEMVVAQASRAQRLQADLHQVRGVKEEIRRKRDGLRQELHGLARERDQALVAVAAVQQRMAARDAEVGRARDKEARLLAQLEALETEKRLALEAAEERLQRLHDLRDDHERLVLGQEAGEALLQQRDETVASQADRILRLEADLLQISGELEEAQTAAAAHNALMAERQAELGRAREAEARLLAQLEALETEKRLALEAAEERLQRLHDLRDDHERLVLGQEAGEALLQQRDETVASQADRILRLEADLLQISGELEEAQTAAAAHNALMAERQAELGRAREAEARLLAQLEALETEKRLALDAAEERLQRLHAALEDHERLFLETRGQHGRITQLEDKLAGLDADLERERSALLAEQTRIASYEREARQARDAEVRMLDRVSWLERENQRIREESEALRVQLNHVLDDLNRQGLAAQRHGDRVVQLEETIAAQATRITGLEAEGEHFKSERDQARQQREEVLRQARSTEADLQAKVRALDLKAERASEETRRLMGQLHHLHEELEQTFLHSQAGDQLIAAQYHQLQRAQSLMSRLLVQSSQSLIPAQAVSVEVLPTPTVHSIAGSSQSGDTNLQRGGGRLLRRFWTP